MSIVESFGVPGPPVWGESIYSIDSSSCGGDTIPEVEIKDPKPALMPVEGTETLHGMCPEGKPMTVGIKTGMDSSST